MPPTTALANWWLVLLVVDIEPTDTDKNVTKIGKDIYRSANEAEADAKIKQLCVPGIRYARRHGTKRFWLTRIMGRRPAKVAAVALANKIARMAWAIMVRSERYKEPLLTRSVKLDTPIGEGMTT